MKSIRGIQRGVKLDPQPTNSERIRELDTELKNLQMASRISQLMVRQMMENVQSLGKDLGKAYGTINELQYKVMAMQDVSGMDSKVLQEKADALRLHDFNEASAAEDVAGNFTVGDVVLDDSTVIITSTTKENSSDIFRSRIQLSTCGVPALIEGLKNKPVGTKVICQLNEVEHEVELLGIRNPPAEITSTYNQTPSTEIQ